MFMCVTCVTLTYTILHITLYTPYCIVSKFNETFVRKCHKIIHKDFADLCIMTLVSLRYLRYINDSGLRDHDRPMC